MAAAPLATQIPRTCPSISAPQRQQQTLHNNLFVRFRIHHATTSSEGIHLVRASSSNPHGQGEEGISAADDKATLLPQEDLNYLVKLGAGSVAGAAAIKYGSIIFPEITQPNLAQALLMITAPVVVAVWLLIRQSRVD